MLVTVINNHKCNTQPQTPTNDTAAKPFESKPKAATKKEEEKKVEAKKPEPEPETEAKKPEVPKKIPEIKEPEKKAPEAQTIEKKSLKAPQIVVPDEKPKGKAVPQKVHFQLHTRINTNKYLHVIVSQFICL